MGIASRLRSLFDVGRALYGWRIDSPQPQDPEADTKALIQAYRSWIYCCAQRNSSRVASVPLKLYATTSKGQPDLRCPHRPLKGRELELVRKTLRPSLKQADVAEVSSHPLLDLLDYVNELMGRFELFELTELHLELTGNAFWWLTSNALGRPQEILVLPPHLVKIKLDSDRLVGAYVLGSPPDERVIPADEVIHFRFPNPDGSVYGYGPAQAAWGSVLDYRSMQLYERSLNQNLGVPSIFIKYQGKVPKEELARIESDWNRKLRGTSKSGKVMVGDTNYDVTPIGLSPREMSFREGRKWARVEIADCFGVPIDLLDTENSNRATATQANYQYEAFTIKPRLARIADKLNERLVPLYDPRLFLQYDENVPRDAAGQLAETVGLKNAGIITVDEARAVYDLPPMAVQEPEPAPERTPDGEADEEPNPVR